MPASYWSDKRVVVTGGASGIGYATARRFVDESAKARMKEVLDDIQSGRFVRDWMTECAAGQPSFKAERRIAAEHGIEEVGAKLRGMMPWIAENALVDKSKN